MRDGHIPGEISRLQMNLSNLKQQLIFIDLRNQAFEKIIFRPWAFIQYIFFPRNILKQVDALQLEMMQQHAKELLRRATEKKPPIPIIPAGAMNGH